jgi:hypothetical protein
MLTKTLGADISPTRQQMAATLFSKGGRKSMAVVRSNCFLLQSCRMKADASFLLLFVPECGYFAICRVGTIIAT